MNVYLELFNKAQEIQELCRPETAFDRDRWGGVTIEQNQIWSDVDKLSSHFEGNAKKFLQLTAQVLEKAAGDVGFGKFRVADGDFGKIVVSIRGGFPEVPEINTSPETVQRIMSQRSGIDVVTSHDKLFLSPCVGWLDLGQNKRISPIGEIAWKTQNDPVFPDGQDPDKYLRALSDDIDELTRLRVANALLLLVQNKVERIVNF